MISAGNLGMTEPFEWQVEAIARGLAEPHLGIFAEPGLGKTYAMINILRGRMNRERRAIKTLIIAPIITLVNWGEEFAKFSKIDPKFILNLDRASTRKKQLSKFTSIYLDKGIILINYEAMLNLDVWKMLYEWGPEILVLDESHYVKNFKSKRTKAITEMAGTATNCYLLTGTPFLNSVADLYSQFKILDGGETFGKNFYLFRAEYMRDANAGFAQSSNYFPKWESNPNSFNRLEEKIKAKTLRVLRKDNLDLPPLVHKVLKVPMSPEQKKVYKEMHRDCVSYINGNPDNAATASTALVKVLRLQQVVSGHIKTEDGKKIIFKANPRLDELVRQVIELGGNKVILWASFIADYKLIADRLTKNNIKFELLTGEQDINQKNTAIKNFRENPNVQCLIANRRAGGIGINLAEAGYSITYSRNFSLGEELQSQARNYRKGSEQHNQIVRIDLVTAGTVDELCYQALKNKENMSKAIIDGIREVKC